MTRRNLTDPGTNFWVGLLFVSLVCFVLWAVWEGMGREIERMDTVAAEYQELVGTAEPPENFYNPPD